MGRIASPSRLLLAARGCYGLASPERVVVVHKTSRLEWEKRRRAAPELANKQSVSSPDYQLLLHRHEVHSKSLDEIQTYLVSRGVAVRMRNRDTYCPEDVEWADIIFAAGGDGNFLFTASKVFCPQKLVVGLNTDPSRSEGFLCLRPPVGGSLSSVLEQVFKGEIKEIHRQRLRIKLGPSLLPVRALNEVFIGEKDHSHASTYYLSYDGNDSEQQKSSGLLVYTGTGSTSWAYNVNKTTTAEVKRVFEIAHGEGLTLPQDVSLDNLATRVTEVCNSSNVFSGEEQMMAFTVREPIVRGIFAACMTRGYAHRVSVRSCSWNASLVVDGQFHYDFPWGEHLMCTLHADDVLRTVNIKPSHKHIK